MRFLWCDLETTGLDNNKCSIIEIACLVTNEDFEVLDEFHEIIKAPNACWSMPALEMHIENNLVQDLSDGKGLELEEVSGLLKMFLERNLPQSELKYYLAGSSVHFDHNFIQKEFDDEINSYFSHRYLDVSSIGLAVTALNGSDVARAFYSDGTKVAHRALDDIKWSLAYFKDSVSRGLIGLLE